MGKTLFLAVAVGILALGPGCRETQEQSGNRAAPEFRLKDSKGSEHSLSDLRGTPVVLHFWASWCAPCIDELPNWVEAAKAAQGKPTRWVAVSLDESWADARKIVKEELLPPNVLSLIDPEKKVPEAYGSFQFPESYLLDGEHKIRAKWVGAQDWQGEKMRKEIGDLARSPAKR